MNPTQPNFNINPQGNQVNALNGFSGYPIFPQGHILPFDVQPGGPAPVLGIPRGADGSAVLPAPAHSFPVDGTQQPISPFFHYQPQSMKVMVAMKFLEVAKNTLVDTPQTYTDFLGIMKDFKNQKIDTFTVIDNVKRLFKSFPTLIAGFNQFLPPQMQIKIEEEKDFNELKTSQPKKSVAPGDKGNIEFDKARSFVKKIKQRFASQPHVYRSFLDLLLNFSNDQQTLSDVYNGVYNLFKDHEDLLQEFSYFLPESSIQAYEESVSQPARSRPATRSSKPKQEKETYTEEEISKQYSDESVGRTGSYGTYEELQYFFRIKEALSETDYEEFLKVLSIYNAKAMTLADLYYVLCDILRDVDDDIINWLKDFLQVEDLVDDEPRGYLADFDWSRSEKLGPSYRSTPMKWRLWKCSGRADDPICAEVLNDIWISVPTGSEDGTFKFSRKNHYEEILFKCEDDRYELDLLIETNLSTIRFLETVYSDILEMPADKGKKFALNRNELSVLHINNIKNIYGSKGEQMIDYLVSKPFVTIPIVVKRLKQKDIEWKDARKEWNKLWSLIFLNNHAKSRDYQSVDFKQEEKKRLHSKNLVSEVRKKATDRRRAKRKPIDDIFEDPFIEVEIKDTGYLDVVKELLHVTFDYILHDVDKDQFNSFFDDFVLHFLKSKKDTEIEFGEEESLWKPTKTTELNRYHQSVFIGTESYYLMFRYICFLFEKLSNAKDLAAGPQPISYTIEEIIKMPEEFMEPKEVLPKESEAGYQRIRFEKFIGYIKSLLKNEIDQAGFETKCRDMFGSFCYKLFSIDRVIILLAKQFQDIFLEEANDYLVSIYKKESKSRNRWSGYRYLTRYRNYFTNEKRAFVMTYDQYSSRLGVKYIDIPSSLTNSENNEELSAYVNSLMDEDVKEGQLQPPPFLKRNIKKIIDDSQVEMLYNLGCKIMPGIYKIRYVRDTEDYFFRKRKR